MKKLDAFFDALLLFLARLAAIILASIAVVIPVNMALKKLGLPMIYGALDAIEYGLLAATFLAAPWVLSINGHVQVDLVTEALSARARRVLSIGAWLVAGIVSAALAWYAFEALQASYLRGATIRKAFAIPEWWTLVMLPVCLILCAIEFARKILRPSLPPVSKAGL
ncbi:TRAP transporter small permease [Hoeflea sp. YIM 152468]|uniref:TRAP transporter small permease n=1 Tax=Hoeflea sp. YIM 152468 TaxID=3031759 RepID=UPI0023D99C79|nr:TRAP transporter small permease [Hoeflea sp. YIM 152468]MDF1609905.1 TRAP transporter small permease [Hoeflea sp. YIM 152468]